MEATRKVIPKWTRSKFECAWQSIDLALKFKSGKRGLGKNNRQEPQIGTPKTELKSAAAANGTFGPS